MSNDERLPPIPNLVKALKAAVAREEWERNGRIYASDLSVYLPTEAGGKCNLGYWLLLHGAKKKTNTSPGKNLMWLQGERLHDFAAEALARELPWQGWRVRDIERRVQIDDDIGSRLDLLLEDPETGKVIVVDFKTKRGSAFGYLNKARPADGLQVKAYMTGLRREGFDVLGGIILYIDREGSNFAKQFPDASLIEPNDDVVARALAHARLLRDTDERPDPILPTVDIKENKGPDSIYLKAPWQVGWCDLEECACAEESFPEDFPVDKDRGVLVGHIQKDPKTGKPKAIKMKDEYKKWGQLTLGIVARKLKEKRDGKA